MSKTLFWADIEDFESLNAQCRALMPVHRRLSPATVLYFFDEDVNASLTDSPLMINASSSINTYIMPRTGHVVGLAAYLNTPRTAGSLTLEPKINSTQLPYSLVIDDDPDQQATIQIPAELATAFEAGDRVGVDITTTGTWTPTSADLQVSLLVRFSMED